MSIELELKNGKRRKFHANVAKVLVARGMGKEVMGYQTRELRAEPARSPEPVQDSELEALKAEADKRGVKYHHRAGVARLRELLAG